MTPIKHFLVTRDAKSAVTTVEEFGTDRTAAQAAYDRVERAVQASPELDVVLLSADSLETVKRTHSSYFDRRPLDDLLPA
jgi:hypothetical protein